ncbi:MAG: glycosyltransferase family 2 protein [Rhodanobacteraceae bacterium]|nr:glycosyltransferase family 2 protein [Rhodanobacteraceae bacterium]
MLVRRNEINLGLSGHVQMIGEIAQGRILVVAAGDDVSQADRVSKLVDRYRADPAASLALFRCSNVSNGRANYRRPRTPHRRSNMPTSSP